jgi:hypothetical protein
MGVMDRVISLLAALVGLIALGGAILVHTYGDNDRRQLETQIASLRASIGTEAPAPARPSSIPSAAASSAEADPGVADALLALQGRISALEATTKSQASELEVARAQLSSMSSMQVTRVATVDPASAPAKGASVAAADVTAAADAIDSGGPAEPKQSPNAAAMVADGPTKDCIPLGTRFMGQGGDSFPLCKTKMVLKVAAVSDGIATITGAGDVAAGASVPYSKGCMLAVFTADTSGYAEMRVTCQ